MTLATMTMATPASRQDFYADDAVRHAALIARDRAADGHFVYAVKTTGVYCRPSCAARRARRENVVFHLTCDDAEHAGFRPCLRCKPRDLPRDEELAARIAKACRMIETAEETPALDELAQAAGLSKFHFHRLFKSVTSLTPRAYAAAIRASHMRAELAAGGRVTDAVYASGFQSSARFYAASHNALGMAPKAYRAGGQGETIRYAFGSSSLGRLIVAATEKGVCALHLGDNDDELLHELKERFPNAEIVAAVSVYEDFVAQAVALVEHPSNGTQLPLDIRGTIFQQRVWQALRGIPAGDTVSYTELARRLGMPKSVRAVANACAANAVAVAVPCHRVVRSDGSLAGYRWGTERKKALIAREAKDRSKTTNQGKTN